MALKNRNRAARAMSKKIALVAALSAVPMIANAQTADADQTGVRIGAGRLNPVIAFETRYDSAAGVDGNEIVGDTIIHIRPGIRFLAPSSSFQLKLDANYDYNAFLSEELSDMSKSTADIDFGVLFNRDGDTQFEVTNRFVRSDRTDVYSVGIDSIVNRNDAGLRLITRSGDSWSLTPSYTLSSQTFESVTALPAAESELERYDNLSHNFGIDARFSLAAKTALLVDVGVGYRGYTGDDTKLPLGREKADDVGNMNLQVGITSMLSQKVGFTVKGGYGSQFGLDDAADNTGRGFGGFVGNAELGWYATELTSVRLGYGRTFQADPNFDYYSDDRLYVESALAFSRQFGLRAGLSYDMVAFGSTEGDAGDEIQRRRRSLPRRPRVPVQPLVLRRRELRAHAAHLRGHGRPRGEQVLQLRPQRALRSGPVPLLGRRQAFGMSGRRIDVGLAMTRAPAALLFALAALALAGCTTRGAAAPGAGAPMAEVATDTPLVGAQTLGSGDVFEVRVVGEEDLSGAYRVASDGSVAFPFCGRVAVGGRTAPETSETLTSCLAAGFLKSPQVTVFLKECNSKKVFVFGEVQKPGTFAYERWDERGPGDHPGRRLLEARRQQLGGGDADGRRQGSSGIKVGVDDIGMGGRRTSRCSPATSSTCRRASSKAIRRYARRNEPAPCRLFRSRPGAIRSERGEPEAV